jgi:hypothetical protein
MLFELLTGEFLVQSKVRLCLKYVSLTRACAPNFLWLFPLQDGASAEIFLVVTENENSLFSPAKLNLLRKSVALGLGCPGEAAVEKVLADF